MFFERNLARAFLAMFGYDPTNKPVPLLLKLIWRHYQTRLDRKNLIDGLPLSETQTIKPYEVATGRNYIDWLLENSDNTQTLEAEDFGEGVAPPHALLYLMLRYALLHEGTHSIFNLRARAQRNLSGEQRKLGLHLGSYGYLENLRPARARHVKIPEDVLPQEMREGADNLFLDSQNGGYVHTPSLNHATGAAILRSGYLTHASPAEQDKLAVNLASARVLRAKYLIDAVRNGQSRGALLVYVFER